MLAVALLLTPSLLADKLVVGNSYVVCTKADDLLKWDGICFVAKIVAVKNGYVNFKMDDSKVYPSSIFSRPLSFFKYLSATLIKPVDNQEEKD